MGILQDAGVQGEGRPVEGRPVEGGNPQVGELLKQATQILYSENFESMISMFQKYGKEGFPQAMATAVNTTLDKLAEDAGGQLDLRTVAEVGVGIFEMILADLHEGGALPDIDKNDVIAAIQEILAMWRSNHPDQVNPEEAKAMVEQMAREMAQSGQLQQEAQEAPMEGAAQPGQPPAQPGQPPAQTEQPPMGV